MTTPNNQPPVPAIPFAVTGSGATGDGSGTSAADLVTRTQSAITALLKQTQIQDSPGWKSATASTYAGLTPGIPYSLAIVEQFVSQVTGLPIGSWATVNEALLAIEGIASNQDLQNNWTTLLTDFGLSPTNAAGLATAILDAAEGNWKPLLALLFGSSTATGVTASIAAPAVADTVHTPQVVSNFSNAASIAGSGWAGGGWSFDSTVSWQGSAGSAKVVADGSVKAMAGVMVPVQPGQTVAVGQTTTDGSAITTAPVLQWAALAAASGIPIEFQLVPYSGPDGARVAGTPFVVAQSASLAPSHSTWQPMTLVTDATNHVASGVYTVPSSGVTVVQARLVVDSVASAGSVWWNNCQLVIAGGYLPTMQAGFQRLQSDAEAATAATQAFLTAVLTAFTNDAGDWPLLIADLSSAYQTWVSTESGLAADEFSTLQQIINSLLGIDISTGQNAQWASVMSQITALQTLLASPPVSAASWAAWWTTTLEALGVDSTGATNTANFLSGNYSAAINANAWAKRKAQNDIIIGDWFHTTYPVGTISDTAATLVGGMRTWWGAWNDNLLLLAQMLGIATPTDPASDVGTTIHGAQAAVSVGIAGSATGVAPDNTTVQTAVSGLTQTVAGLQSQVSALQSPASGPTTILRDNGQDLPGSGLGSSWTQTQVAAVNRDATYGFKWQSSGSTPRTCVGVYNSPLATTDQVGTIVLNTLMSFGPSGSPYAYGAPENWIILRANSPTSPTSWVGWRVRYADVQFGYMSGGVITMLGSPTTFFSTASSSYSGYAGDASSDFSFKLVSAGRVIASYTDSAHVTSGSLTGRYSGQMWKSDAGNFTLFGTPIESVPASTSWLSYDASASAGTPIGFGHITRVDATGVTMSGGYLPYTYYDTQISLGSGLTVPASGNAGLIVGQAGLYAVSYGLRHSSTSNATDLYPGISVNGVLQEVGPTFMYDGGGTLLNGGSFGMASAGVLCNAGDLLSPWQGVQSGLTTGNGLTGAGGSVWNGDSTGTRAFFKVAKIG